MSWAGLFFALKIPPLHVGICPSYFPAECQSTEKIGTHMRDIKLTEVLQWKDSHALVNSYTRAELSHTSGGCVLVGVHL